MFQISDSINDYLKKIGLEEKKEVLIQEPPLAIDLSDIEQTVSSTGKMVGIPDSSGGNLNRGIDLRKTETELFNGFFSFRSEVEEKDMIILNLQNKIRELEEQLKIFSFDFNLPDDYYTNEYFNE